MAVIYNQEFYTKYVHRENEVNQYHISEEDMRDIVSLLEYFGTEMYRPITRLLMSNWTEITERLATYTTTDWDVPKRIAQTLHLNVRSVAILIEVFEGEDTIGQNELLGKKIDADDLQKLRRHIESEEE